MREVEAGEMARVLGHYLQEVVAGESFVVTRYRRPTAVLLSMKEYEEFAAFKAAKAHGRPAASEDALDQLRRMLAEEQRRLAGRPA